LFPQPPAPAPQPVDPIVVVDPVNPVTGAAWIHVVEESSQRTPQLIKLLRDPWWQAGAIQWRVWDKDAEGIGDVLDAVKNVKLPAIVITDKDGDVLHAGQMPVSIDGVKKLVGAK
jgi:hypothetical protein